MAVAVHEDILKNPGTLTEGPNGYTAERFFLVTGLTGTTVGKLATALADTRVPQLYMEHPAIAGLPLKNRRAQFVQDDTAAVRIQLTYGLLDAIDQLPESGEPPILSISSAIQEVVTQRDVNGNPIVVQHTFPNPIDPDTGEPIVGPEVTKTQIAEVAYQVPAVTLSKTRREAGAPETKALVFVGKVNVVKLGRYYWPRTLLCTNISGVSRDGGVTYDVSYEFQYNPLTWDPWASYIDPETGRPPDRSHLEPEESLGELVQVKLYREIDFALLQV